MPEALPIDPLLPEIVASLRRCPSLVLVAPPGAGKTTRVPPELLRAGLVQRPVLVLQPRRVAARAAARRIASEQGWRLGEEVGYQVRFERCGGPLTPMQLLTEGILTRRLQDDPLLEGIGAVILDEFHERSVHTDLALALVREAQRARPELRVVVMSATLSAEAVRTYLGDCPLVEAQGRVHPLEITYLERCDTRPLAARAASGVRRALREIGAAPGDLLVFLPGAREIRQTAEQLEDLAASVELLPLHGSLPLEDQDRVLRPGPRRKVILATNVAETSLTIEGVTVVVDTGYARLLRHDSRTGLDRLDVARISQASAEQRGGRAGRTAPGRVYRLWTRAEHASLPAQTPPEIQRIDLAGPALLVRAWGGEPVAFPWFERPGAAALRAADALLAQLGAVDTAQCLTDLGRQLSSLPLHPRLGRLLVAAHRRGCVAAGAALVALLAERDLLVGPDLGHATARDVESGPSDLLLRLERLEEARRADFRAASLRPWGIDAGVAQHAWRSAEQLGELAGRLLGATTRREPSEEELQRLVLEGYPDRVARRRTAHGDRAVMVGGRGVVLDARSVVKEAELFVAVDLQVAGVEARVHLASAIDASWLPTRVETVTRYDAEAERVVATRRVLYEDLVLDESPLSVEGQRAGALLAGVVERDGLAALQPAAEVQQLLARLRCLRGWMPELQLPAFDGPHLASLLSQLCAGAVSLADVRRRDLGALLLAALTPQQRLAVDRHAPERLEVPSGSRLRLTYEAARPPVLAVRLQEVFGLADTPRVAAGRACVLLHLLGPNGRPVQITQDLRSFWDVGYPEVRKELRRRYPRHAWPEDPWTARPERQPRRRRR